VRPAPASTGPSIRLGLRVGGPVPNRHDQQAYDEEVQSAPAMRRAAFCEGVKRQGGEALAGVYV